ncbi:Mitochondrial genome maintenance exonuclease 1 [Amphibalanus amphitrite]|uniref:Mitochondrial genome maintenance exonuclease 1 n=1 Tax=Amphibalanus amphitrite TaxID=1232801 RepID=A0A6A4X3V5_AMPAM|nr:Mitochondrial genome maintenance exonuclease 1 [Amphibalanus amphitrite]KAF0314396.1 Mitochondrial genome maintenance exonuclease 1 [Amphibalanus amphitrite]
MAMGQSMRLCQAQRKLLQLLSPLLHKPSLLCKQLCLGASVAAARRNLPRYRYELENRLLYGRVVRTPSGAPAEREADPPAGVTVVSERGFPEGSVGVSVRPRSRRTSASATSSTSTASPKPSAAAVPEPAATSSTTGPSATSSATPRSRSTLLGTSSAAVPPVSYMYPTEEPTDAHTERLAAPLPSVSRVLQATMSEESRAALRRWEEAMIARHGPDGFAQIKEAMFSVGRELHAAIHRHLLGSAPEAPLSPAADGFWRSVRPALRHVDGAGLLAAERPLRHTQLGYQGVVDCVAPFRSCPMVIEWKTARRPKYSVRELYDNPVQAAAYLGAYNYTHRNAQVDRAAVVVAYESGRPATVHVLSPAECRRHWAAWLQRLLQYRRETDVV